MATPPKPPSPPTAPPQPETPVQKSEPAARKTQVRNLELKATLLLAFTVALIVASGLFPAARPRHLRAQAAPGAAADNAEGVVAGMDLTFAGFPIGTVKRVSLGERGNVRIDIDVIEKDAKWLRTSSVFTLIKPIFGGAAARLQRRADRPGVGGRRRAAGAARRLQRGSGTGWSAPPRTCWTT